MPESTTYECNCSITIPGTTVPPAPYVVSIANLQGIVSLGDTGAIQWRTDGNTIYADFTASAGLGSVTSVALASSNSNLTVVSGSPVTTSGTITLSFAGNIGSISGLVMAADQMIYSTAADTFAATSLTAFARTLLDDAAAVNARSTLGLVIGTDVQAFSQDLADFVTNVTWSGSDITFTGALTALGNITAANDLNVAGTLIGSQGATFVDDVVAGFFNGDGSLLTNLNASNAATGTLAVARGGTNISSYAVGDLIHATGATTLTKLPSVSAGSYLRSAGVTTASVWSTLKLPNSATVGDILFCNSSDNISSLADVAANNVLLSGGVGVAPLYGKVTSSHTDGTTIATISAGDNSNITSMSGDVSAAGSWTFNSLVILNSELNDSSFSPGASGDILTSTGSGVLWSNQITLDTLTINTNIGIEGTITAGGTTGNQTINKPSGTVRIATGNGSVVVTNSLCTTSHRVLACVCTNDTTAYVKNVVTTTGSFTITLGANATAETEIYWTLLQVT